MILNIYDKPSKFIFIRVPKTGSDSLYKMLPPSNNPTESGGHESIQKHQQYLKNTFSSYYSFGFVRNPWDRAVSLYEYCLETYLADRYKDIVNFDSFKTFIETSCNPDHTGKNRFTSIHMKPQYDYLSIQNRLAVDFVGRFETLEEDTKNVFNSIGVEMPETFLHTHKTKSRPHYSEYYNDRLQKLVGKQFALDVTNFEYTLEK